MISLIVSIALVGVIVYCLTTFIPMPAPFQKAIYIVASVGLLLYLLQYFGLWNGFELPRRHR
jgi:sulfite exporter TauE/SafE